MVKLVNIRRFDLHKNGSVILLWCEGMHRRLFGSYNYPDGVIDRPVNRY